MKNLMIRTRKNIDTAYFGAVQKVKNYVTEKKQGGFETFVVILLIIAICCGLAAIFKEQATDFLKEVFKSLKDDVLTDFIAKPTA